jgi:hypothetical protein
VHNPNTICIVCIAKSDVVSLFRIFALSFLMVAVVQCQDRGGLGSFHDIRKKLARSFFGGPLLGMGIFFDAGQPDTKLFSLTNAVLLILQILFNTIHT